MHSTDTNLTGRASLQPSGNRPKNQSTGATESLLSVYSGVHSTVYSVHRDTGK